MANKPSSTRSAEALLRDVSMRRAIEEAVCAGISATDARGVQIYANRAFSEMVGWSSDELVGATPPFVYWPPEEIPEIQAALEATLHGEAPPGGFELRFCRKSGERFDVLVMVSPFRDSEAESGGWVASIYDITERKRAEEGQRFLSEASELFSQSLDQRSIATRLARLAVPRSADWCLVRLINKSGDLEPVAMAHQDPAKTELAWELERRWPLPPDAPVGEPLAVRTGQSLFQPRIPAERLEQAAQDQEHLRLLRQLHLRSSIVAPLKARGRTLGTITLISADSGRDFTRADLALAEELAGRAALAIDNARLYFEAEYARREAELAAERFHFLLEASNAIASATDDQAALQELANYAVSTVADYCVTYLCDEGGAIRRVGLAHRDPARRKLVEDLHRAGPPTLDSPGAGEVIRTGEPMLAREISADYIEASAQNLEHLRVLRELGPRSCILVPLRARSRILGAVALVTTRESERLYTQEDLLLAQKLASRTALMVDNALLYRRAREAVAVRDEVMSILSHDLKTPLQTIQTASVLLKDAANPQTRGRSLAVIRRSIERMNRLIQDLLDAARLEEGKLSLDQESVELAPLFAESVALLQQEAGEQSVLIEQEIEPGLAPIRGDRERLLQVLTNLLSNALNVLPKGGEICLRAERREEQARIEVTDTGPGIDEADLPKLFDRFWQTRRIGTKGAGLGLAIAKGILEAHGSALEVESAVGWGTSFSFSLALAEQERFRGSGPVSGRQVLIVEDDDALCRELAEFLEEHGYEVVCASNGRAALAYLESHPLPGLVFLDLMMPAMNGWELLTLLRTDKRFGALPIAILSCVEPGHADLQTLRPDEYLVKPVTLARLLEVTSRHLGEPGRGADRL